MSRRGRFGSDSDMSAFLSCGSLVALRRVGPERTGSVQERSDSKR